MQGFEDSLIDIKNQGLIEVFMFTKESREQFSYEKNSEKLKGLLGNNTFGKVQTQMISQKVYYDLMSNQQIDEQAKQLIKTDFSND